MYRFILIIVFNFIVFSNLSFVDRNVNSNVTNDFKFNNDTLNIYKKLDHKNLKLEVFSHALNGYLELKAENKLRNSRYLSIIDMSLSSNEERLFIIDMDNKSIVHQSIVAHGKNSGLEFATSFSNQVNSHQSSLGFYKTAETYHGKHGLSLRLDGLEFSNNNARKRAIVIHSADYATKNFIERNGRLGRSFGCPSLPKKDYTKIIAKIKSGSVLFIYSPDPDYLENSNLITQS